MTILIILFSKNSDFALKRSLLSLKFSNPFVKFQIFTLQCHNFKLELLMRWFRIRFNIAPWLRNRGYWLRVWLRQ